MLSWKGFICSVFHVWQKKFQSIQSYQSYLMVLGIFFFLWFLGRHNSIFNILCCCIPVKPGTLMNFYHITSHHISLRKSFLPSCYVIELQNRNKHVSLMQFCKSNFLNYILDKFIHRLQDTLNPIKRQTMLFWQVSFNLTPKPEFKSQMQPIKSQLWALPNTTIIWFNVFFVIRLWRILCVNIDSFWLKN